MQIETVNRKVFLALGQEKKLVEYRDIIAKLLGIVIDFVNADGENLRLSQMPHFNAYCVLLRKSPSGRAACAGCDRSNAHAASLVRCRRSYRCHAGVIDALLPLFSCDGEYIGGMTAGQFLLEGEAELDAAALTALARRHGVEPEALGAAYRELPRLSLRQLDGVFDYLAAIGRTIVDAYEHVALLENLNRSDKLEEIRAYVEKNYTKPMPLPKVARRFAMSEGYFCRFFMDGMRMSFLNYVAIVRVSKAVKLLRASTLSVSEIAFRTGFGSLSQFNRTFKSVTGQTPRHLRQSEERDSGADSVKINMKK